MDDQIFRLYSAEGMDDKTIDEITDQIKKHIQPGNPKLPTENLKEPHFYAGLDDSH